MGDQRILNPDIRVGSSFERMVAGNADLAVTLVTTFRYSRRARRGGGVMCVVGGGEG